MGRALGVFHWFPHELPCIAGCSWFWWPRAAVPHALQNLLRRLSLRNPGDVLLFGLPSHVVQREI